MKIAAEPGIAAAGQAPVMAAIKRAGEATGANFELLFNMARRESSLNPMAEAKTSSAAGLFQFIDQTWLAAVKKYGAKHGLEAAAADIAIGDNGKYAVADVARRKEILDLRFDPAKAAALAGELAQENRAGLERRLGRAVNNAELYAAHFLGVGGAAKLLTASPNAKAADVTPQAAAANRPVFYGASGPRTVAEVMGAINRSMGAAVEGVSRQIAERSAGAPTKAPRETRSAAELVHTTAPVVSTRSPGGAAPAPFIRASVETDGYRLLELINARAHSAALTPLAIAVLQSLDPTGIGARK